MIEKKGRMIDELRIAISKELDSETRSELGQYFTPSSISDFMVSLFSDDRNPKRLLDPGAGVGSLQEVFLNRFTDDVSVTAYELDEKLASILHGQLELFSGDKTNTSFEVINKDFIFNTLNIPVSESYTHIILNPPYKKIRSNSQHAKTLKLHGVPAPNLYVAFLAISVLMAEEGAEIVAIIPRSFCNGLYFKDFRNWLLPQVAIEQIHLFESRKKAFSDDDVLQENIIIKLRKSSPQNEVKVTWTEDLDFSNIDEQYLDFNHIVQTDDTESYIRIPKEISHDSDIFTNSLDDIDVQVSTGPVVDFRVKELLRDKPLKQTVPLLYPSHFMNGNLTWPKEHKKPNAIHVNDTSKKQLMPRGWYVVLKRFSSKEERRRVVANIVNPFELNHDYYAFENHLNVLHLKKEGLKEELARGLFVYLNSTLVDEHFRTFSGHTQVNATDVRNMSFPDADTLMAFGNWQKKQIGLTQETIDGFIEQYVREQKAIANSGSHPNTN